MKAIGGFLVATLAVSSCWRASGAPPPRVEAPDGAASVEGEAPPDSTDEKPELGIAPTGPASIPVAAPAARSEAPYDLAADVVRLEGQARRDLGARARTQVVRSSLVLVAAPDFAGGLPSSAGLVESALDAFLNERFRRLPEQAIAVYLFGGASSYEAYCRSLGGPCISQYGFYDPSRRQMVMNAGLGLGTLTHELVHPILEEDFPGAPTWLDEGIASLFEAPVIPRKGEIHGRKNWRHPRLMAAFARPEERGEATVTRLLSLSDGAFRDGREDLHYATARYLCQWLDERGALWAFYRRFRDTKDRDATGELAFREVVQMSPAEADVAFARWARSL
jgi:hypothetical protein